MRNRWAAATGSGAVDAPAAGSGQGPALSRRRGALSALAIIAQDRQRGLSAAGRPSGLATHRRSCRPSAYRRARQADACREMEGRSRRTARSDSGGRRCAGCAGARRCRRRRPRGRTADMSPPSRGRLARGRRRCAAAPTSSWLLVLVLGGRRVGLGPVDRAAPALDVRKLMAKNDHRAGLTSRRRRPSSGSSFACALP